jgi:hypothetical protein
MTEMLSKPHGSSSALTNDDLSYSSSSSTRTTSRQSRVILEVRCYRQFIKRKTALMLRLENNTDEISEVASQMMNRALQHIAFQPPDSRKMPLYSVMALLLQIDACTELCSLQAENWEETIEHICDTPGILKRLVDLMRATPIQFKDAHYAASATAYLVDVADKVLPMIHQRVILQSSHPPRTIFLALFCGQVVATHLIVKIMDHDELVPDMRDELASMGIIPALQHVLAQSYSHLAKDAQEQNLLSQVQLDTVRLCAIEALTRMAEERLDFRDMVLREGSMRAVLRVCAEYDTLSTLLSGIVVDLLLVLFAEAWEDRGERLSMDLANSVASFLARLLRDDTTLSESSPEVLLATVQCVERFVDGENEDEDENAEDGDGTCYHSLQKQAVIDTPGLVESLVHLAMLSDDDKQKEELSCAALSALGGLAMGDTHICDALIRCHIFPALVRCIQVGGHAGEHCRMATWTASNLVVNNTNAVECMLQAGVIAAVICALEQLEQGELGTTDKQQLNAQVIAIMRLNCMYVLINSVLFGTVEQLHRLIAHPGFVLQLVTAVSLPSQPSDVGMQCDLLGALDRMMMEDEAVNILAAQKIRILALADENLPERLKTLVDMLLARMQIEELET